MEYIRPPASFYHAPPTVARSKPNRLLIISILGSFLAGFVGGLFGATTVQTNSRFSKFLPTSSSMPVAVEVKEDSAVIDVVKKASPAVVSIVISKDVSQSESQSPFWYFFGEAQSAEPNIQQIGAGTGFFITNDGLVLTNKHVVADADATYKVVTEDGKTYDAEVLSMDPVNDLALLRVPIQNAPILSLADGSVTVGQRVIAIGNSLGQYQNTVTTGVISGIGRSIVAGGQGDAETLDEVLQTDAAINPGNSGGPLLDILGQVIGISTAVDLEGQLVGFAIPAGDARVAVESYNRFGRIVRPFLGVRYILVNESIAKERNLVYSYGALLVRGPRGEAAVAPGSPAAQAGLIENTMILEVNSTKIDTKNPLARALRKFNSGDEVELKVYQQGKERIVKLRLTETR
jgi:serine protease Do